MPHMSQMMVRESDFALIENLSNGFVIRYQQAVAKEVPISVANGDYDQGAMVQQMVSEFSKQGILPKKENWSEPDEDSGEGKDEKKTVTTYSLVDVATYCADEDACAKVLVLAKKAHNDVKKHFAGVGQSPAVQSLMAYPYPR